MTPGQAVIGHGLMITANSFADYLFICVMMITWYGRPPTMSDYFNIIASTLVTADAIPFVSFTENN